MAPNIVKYASLQMTQVHGKGTFVRSLESLKFFSLHLGVTAGSAGLARTVFAPLYRAQILMQIRDISVRDTRYMSAADYLWRAAQREGFTSHW